MAESAEENAMMMLPDRLSQLKSRFDRFEAYMIATTNDHEERITHMMSDHEERLCALSAAFARAHSGSRPVQTTITSHRGLSAFASNTGGTLTNSVFDWDRLDLAEKHIQPSSVLLEGMIDAQTDARTDA